ncbi:DUF1559 domain-containing protein, partial [bacterium]|nr:DUF1559 domain-containing protein [bacterium]
KDKESVTAIESGIAAIDSVKYQQNSMTAIITADAKIDLSDLLPVFKETENRFRVSTSISNARLVSQSLQAFEAETGKVPSSVMISEHGKEYSWRIAILPFIGHQYIYDRYRFDEAWNSPNNLKVTESMPDFFGHPDDPKDSTNSRMFFVVGNGTMFKNSLHSKSTSEIADGASDTIMAVQAKRDIHWAKPQDIEFDPTNLNFGGFGGDSYTVTLADGSVQRISQNADQEELTKALTPDGGEAIDSSKLFSGQK